MSSLLSKVCELCSNAQAFEGPVPGKDELRVECPSCLLYFRTPDSTGAIREGEPIRLAWLARREAEAGRPLHIHSRNILELLSAAPTRQSPLDVIDEILMRIAKAPSAEKMVTIREADYPSVCAFNPAELGHFLNVAKDDLAYVDRSGSSEFRLKPKGWERVLEVRRAARKSDQAFVAMWFDSETDAAWTSGFKPGLEDSGYRPLRIDLKEHNNKIDDEIIAEIRKSGLLVADFTGQRQGVYYEAGFASGIGLPVVWTCRKDWMDRAHFDVRQYSHIVWESPDELRRRLRARVDATIPRTSKGSPSATP